MKLAFTYWDKSDISLLAEVTRHWDKHVDEFRIVGDGDICNIIEKIDPSFIETYERITIPAARSDLARLIYLYEFGGLYVDSHCGVHDRDGLAQITNLLKTKELIFVNEASQRRPRPTNKLFLINAMIACQKESSHILDIAKSVMRNLSKRRTEEAANGFSYYNLLCLSGPFIVTALTTQSGSKDTLIEADLAGKTHVYNEEAFPIRRYIHQMQRSAGVHWSERQKTELLFRK
jgi:mannosyltransferase OCH1-like enzyme